MTISEFQQKDGSMWYSLINGDLFKRAIQCVRDNSPASRLHTQSNVEIKEFGVQYAAQLQGFNEALTLLTEGLLVQPGEELPEPTYQDDQ